MYNLLQLSFFFFNDSATSEIYTLSLHDALPISRGAEGVPGRPDRLVRLLGVLDLAAVVARLGRDVGVAVEVPGLAAGRDRKSTRLNSSHANISYAVFCLKKKKNKTKTEFSNELI